MVNWCQTNSILAKIVGIPDFESLQHIHSLAFARTPQMMQLSLLELEFQQGLCQGLFHFNQIKKHFNGLVSYLPHGFDNGIVIYSNLFASLPETCAAPRDAPGRLREK